MQTSLELLSGAYDLHIHAGPSVISNLYDDIELLESLEQLGMGGAVVKSHFENTAARVKQVNAHYQTKARLYGSLVLNQHVGGLNPCAVESALRMGAKTIWLPTNHAQSFMDRASFRPIVYEKVAFENVRGITAIDEQGNIRPEVYEIFELVKKHDALLQTAHLGIEEGYRTAMEAIRFGVRTVITHTDAPCTKYPNDLAKELADAGAYIDKNWNNILRGRVSAEQVAADIRFISPQRCILTTDMGARSDAIPPEALKMFIEELLKNGFSEEEIRLMAVDNPKYLLGIS